MVSKFSGALYPFVTLLLLIDFAALTHISRYLKSSMNRHPGEEEAASVKAKYKQKLCSYGDSCVTEGCLYFHPYESAYNEQEQTYTHEIASAVSRLDLASSHNIDSSINTPSYEEWLAQSCPAPSHLDVNQVNNIWFYTSGMQRDPWDVYNMMYAPPGSSNEVNHNVAPVQLGDIHATTQSWNPAGSNNISSDPATFEEWKKMGCNFPTWFQSDIDPWYDEEGMRRSLEEVYEVLYGENAQARFEEQEALRYQLETSADPTPAELLANGDKKQSADFSSAWQTSNNAVKSNTGWAKVASKPPAPQARSISTSNNTPLTSSSTAKGKKSSTIIMPKECWLPSTDNSNYFISHPNPIERYEAINKQHESYLSNVSIPTSLEGSTPGGKVMLIDVHFQSAKSITAVLDRYLFPALNQCEEVWIIAGMGSHIEAGHQKRGNSKTGGVLFNAVKAYLTLQQEEQGIEWWYGKEAAGTKYANGSFLVRKK
eukprot:scaffold320162_cov96-Cyclotella_meneghiniana.AAC.1